MIFKKAILVIILLHALLQTFSQQENNYRFINFTNKDGLSDRYIYCAEQDNRGNMWFGTSTGLFRYDGHSFKKFMSNADQPGHTINNVLQAIYKDDRDILWLGSVNTLQWFNPSKNAFWSPDFSDPNNKKLAAAYIFSFSKGKNGTVWIGTVHNYFFCFNPADSSFIHFSSFPPGASKETIKVAETDNALYAVHTEGVYEFSKTGVFQKFYHIPAGSINDMFWQEKTQTLFLSCIEGGLIKFNTVTKAFTRNFSGSGFIKKDWLYTCIEDGNENLYLGGHQFAFMNGSTNQFLRFSKDPLNEFSIHAVTIGKLFLDREKNLWICSFNGLALLPWQNSQLVSAPLKDKITNNLVEPIIVEKAPGTHQLLISNTSTAGLIVYNISTGKVETIENKTGKTTDEKRISGIIITPDSNVYLSDDRHMFRYLPAVKQMVPADLKDQYGKTLRNIRVSILDKSGNVYIGTAGNGFYKWLYSSGRIIHYTKADVDKTDSTTGGNKIRPYFTDSKGNVWFTCNNGVYKYDPSADRFYHHAFKEQPGTPLVGESAGIAEDRQGHIWITTKANGIFEWYIQNGKEVLNNYNQRSGIGLRSDYLWTIKKSGDGLFLWISSSEGLIKFDPVQKKVVVIFNKQTGMFDDGGGYTFNVLPDGQVAQLYYAGITLINAPAFRENKTLPKVQFNSIKVMDRENVYELTATNELPGLRYNQNFLQFEFTALVMNNSNGNSYAYKLDGVDRDWIYSDHINTASYSGLQDGHYIFKVKAANNNGYWGEETSVAFTISPPFYATWWFLLLCGLLLAAAIFWWYRFKVNNVKKEERLKAAFQQQIAEMEMKALRAQMNPHFIFNSLNSIQRYILKNEQLEASQYLTKFSRLIRLILDHSDQGSIPLQSEIELIRLYIEMESLRFDNKFDYEINIDKNLDNTTFYTPSMLLQPYIENAIWHGLLHKSTRGKLLLDIVTDASGNLTVMIDDDGIGRKAAGELKSKQLLTKKSYGMQISKDRIDIINRLHGVAATCTVIDKKDAYGNATGTTVILVIPSQTVKK